MNLFVNCLKRLHVTCSKTDSKIIDMHTNQPKEKQPTIKQIKLIVNVAKVRPHNLQTSGDFSSL